MQIEYEDENTTQQLNPSVEDIRLSNKSELSNVKAKLWEKITKTEVTGPPISEVDVAKKVEESDTVPLPDRALVAKDLAEFIRNRKKEPTPLEEQAARLEQALNQIAKPKEKLSFEDIVARKLEAIEARIEQRDREEVQRREQEEYEKSMSEYSEQIIEFINSRKEDYPGIVALGRQELVFNQLLNLIDAGQDASEVDVTRAMEDQLRADFEKLRTVYDSSSKAANSSKQPKQTKTQTKPPQETEFDASKFANLKDAQAALWERLASGG